jgi:hypothetical protein
MPNPAIAHYQDTRGVQHDVVVRKAPNGAWQVADISVRKTTSDRDADENRRRPTRGRGHRTRVRARKARRTRDGARRKPGLAAPPPAGP